MEAWKAQLTPAGIDLQLNVMPGAQYWDLWDKTPFGFTSWTHRPLGVMVLNLAYRSGVPWNETGYNNPDFDAMLDDASATLDVDERRKKMEGIEKLLQNEVIFVQPLWRAVFTAAHNRVKGFGAHPTVYHIWNGVWLES